MDSIEQESPASLQQGDVVQANEMHNDNTILAEGSQQPTSQETDPCFQIKEAPLIVQKEEKEEEISGAPAVGAASDLDEEKTCNESPIIQSSTVQPPEQQQQQQQEAATTAQHQFTFLERQARRCARWPKTHLLVSLGVAVILSAVGLYFGDFTITVQNVGWPSRGTLISDRETQNKLITRFDGALSRSSGEANDAIWVDLTTNVQPGWETRRYDKEDEKNDKGKRVDIQTALEGATEPTGGSDFKRKNVTELVDQCDIELYMRPSFLQQLRLWPVWEVAPTATSSDNGSASRASATDPVVLEDLCLAEERTQHILEKEGLCYGCNNDTECLPPYSIVLYARFTVPHGLTMNCSTLAASWEPYRGEEEAKWKKCVAYLQQTAGDLDDMDNIKRTRYCPPLFSPSLVDEWFEQTGTVQYTSTIFVTYNNRINDLYDISEGFARGTPGIIEGTYDTQIQNFIELYANDIVGRDTILSVGAAAITMLAMMIHTRSPFLTLVGLFQIILGFPLSFFVYHFVLGLTFFPFLNLVGVFVIFALGADHVFVAVDKWKNARNDNPRASTEEIAGKALPSAGRAMILTTITTAIAFFGSAMCPVAPIVLFATFSGTLIVIDYILDVVVMFPCLCIYDSYRFQRNYCVDFRCRNNQRPNEEEEIARDPEVETERQLPEVETERQLCCIEEEKTSEHDEIHSVNKQELVVYSDASLVQDDTIEREGGMDPDSLIRRILHNYYEFMHYWRWALLVLSAIALGTCTYFATTLQVPDTPTEVQLLASNVEYQKNLQWRSNLLLDSLLKESGSVAHIVWGVQPADTGDHLDPFTWSTLVLDNTFEPSTEAAQEYLRDFCQSLYNQEFADFVGEEKLCSINEFDEWLQAQSKLLPALQNTTYVDYCEDSTGLPISPESFHGCLTAWSEQENDKTILSWNGTVKMIRISFKSTVRYNSPSKDLGEQWHMIEDWMQAKQGQEAPLEVSLAFFSSMDWWWWDTTQNVYQTAISSGAIAITVSAVVILVTSRSLSMTLFSAISVVYVLVSVTAVMSAAGWTLGFL